MKLSYLTLVIICAGLALGTLALTLIFKHFLLFGLLFVALGAGGWAIWKYVL